MLVSEYINKLPDETYKLCTITATAVTLPIDTADIAGEVQGGLSDTLLSNEKAVCLAINHLKSISLIDTPLSKLHNYYKLKTA